MVYDRKANSTFTGSSPVGLYGQISLGRLCETLESCGEVRPPERITHLEIVGDVMKYRVERDEPKEA